MAAFVGDQEAVDWDIDALEPFHLWLPEQWRVQKQGGGPEVLCQYVGACILKRGFSGSTYESMTRTVTVEDEGGIRNGGGLLGGVRYDDEAISI